MTIAHEVTGEGPTVVLLHSTVCDRRMWTPLVRDLAAAGHRVITCDLPGFGDTPVPAEPYNDADEVSALFDRAALIGSSGGGGVALELAARFPSRVTALALLCTALPGHPPSEARRAFGNREDALLAAGDLEAATALNVSTWLGPEASVATRASVHTMQRHAFDIQRAAPEPAEITHPYDIAAITAPTLLVSGAHDLPEFTDTATHVAATLPNADHRHLDWAGHLPSLERPDLINPLLIDFLS
ncbi:alpha/beta fold hydrolase [Actinoplanes sp. NPDC089786]|uniref:alpha/beta fold hydrolase n=1 Tax=Actinoplanes sp. NPDC089786 TaxID=3155185 RepID=UPI003434EB49